MEKEASSGSYITTAHGITDVLILALSILGFLQATTERIYFFSPEERSNIIRTFRELLSDQFMTAVEGALSSVRVADTTFRPLKDFKFFLQQYSRFGRPLSAMLLQQAFSRMLMSCSALELTNFHDLQESSILDYLLQKQHPQLFPAREEHLGLIEMLSEISAATIHLLDEGADYLELETTWQKHLAYRTRSHTLVTFLACMLVDEDIADVDLLMLWLEDSMADGGQMADQDLACTVLKCLTIIAKTSQAIASSLSRSLSRFIAQGDIQGPVVTIAAQCLASIFQMLSQDSIITGIYSLGNVLSASKTDRGIAIPLTANGSSTPKESKYTQHAVGSAISIDVTGEEETSFVYTNIVRAIVIITTECTDEKITSLALSMLLQKLARVNLKVDLAIITETAVLGLICGVSDLKSLLKLYGRLGHEAVTKDNTAVLEAVRLNAFMNVLQS